MKEFDYDGFQQAGLKRRRGRIKAGSREVALEALNEQGVEIHSIVEVAERRSLAEMVVSHRPVRQNELMVLTRTLATLLDAGIPLLSSLETVAANNSYRLQTVLGEVAETVAAGVSLNEAMAAHPQVFDKLYVAFVRAGEESGDLPGSFVMLATQLEQSEKLRQAIRQATLYPKLVAGVAVAATLAVAIAALKSQWV